MRWFVGVVFGAAVALAQAQDASKWIVKQDWVKADEDYLASDALRGRGSATDDEKKAAEFVVKKFQEFGLKPAPGMDGYFQTAKIIGHELDGRSTLTIGALTFQEGKDYVLLTSSGSSESGELKAVRADTADDPFVPKGSVVIITDIPPNVSALKFTAAVHQSNKVMVIAPFDAGAVTPATMFGGKARVPVGVEGQPEPKPGATTVLLGPAAMAKIKVVVKGAVTLTVHDMPRTSPRMTYNAIGYLPGSDPNAGVLMLSAHLDHLGVGLALTGDPIWNGANDDASGTTAVIEMAHALTAGPQLKRSVLFVCFGSEELGELGSTYFGEHPPVPLTSLVADIEFEMIGAHDPKLPKGELSFTGWERSNLGPTLKEHGALLGPDKDIDQHYFERSDNYSLALRGVVAHTAGGWVGVATYHQPNDDVAHLDLPFMTEAIQSLVEPVRWLASGDFKPSWKHGGQPKPGDLEEQSAAQQKQSSGRKR